MSSRVRLGLCATAVYLLLVVCSLRGLTVRADCPLYRLPTNRFGVDVNSNFGRIADYDVGVLHIGWYSDWATNLRPLRPGGIEYAQMIWVSEGEWSVAGAKKSWTLLGQALDANPGSLWMIGNEPECPYPPGGGNMTPEQYAGVYHDLYGFIKGRDAKAQVAIGGVVQPTPLRLKWLDQVLQYYTVTYGITMPVDVWNIHNMILQEMRGNWGCGIPAGLTENEGRPCTIVQHSDIKIFKQQIVEFRTWMRDRGFRDKPLIISEYGILFPSAYGFTVPVVNAFMTASFDYMRTITDANSGYPADSNLLVQRWAWNSLNDQPFNFTTGQGFNGGLFDYLDNTFPGTPTAFGLNYSSYTTFLLTGPACITGTVHLEARPPVPDASHVTTATLTLLPVDCPQPDLRRVTTNGSGVFTLCNVLTGTYDIVVKGFNTLATRTNAVVLPAGRTSVDLGLLRSGDANNDNYVTILDFSILVAAYGSVRGDAVYDLRADFNNDGRVSILDFSLLATHYSEMGAQ